MPLVALHWEKYLNRMVGRYNDIYRLQIPNITPHVCRHTYFSNMARSGCESKGSPIPYGPQRHQRHDDHILNLCLDDARNEMVRLEELERARKEVEKASGEHKEAAQNMFKVV